MVAGGEGNGSRYMQPISPCPASHALTTHSAAWGHFYFRLIVVFTPCEVVLSSNQRAVTVLVWV